MSTEADKLRTWLQELGSKNHIALDLDNNSLCQLKANNGVELVLSGQPGCDYFSVSVKLAQIPEHDKQALFHLALTLNLAQEEMDGASIALNPETDGLVLHRVQKYRFTDYRKFTGILDSMVEVGYRLKQQFCPADEHVKSPNALPESE